MTLAEGNTVKHDLGYIRELFKLLLKNGTTSVFFLTLKILLLKFSS